MPREERFITFDTDEIIEAIHLGCTREEQPAPPEGTLSHMESRDQGDKGRVMMHISEKNGNTTKIPYTLQFFALSLVFFCQNAGIPIPRAGTKTLKVMPDKVIMKIEI
jgi:hypothetical protein